MINEEKLQKEITIMKRSIVKMVREENKDLIGCIEKWNQKIILAVADFQCQKCGSEENLQIHHLIMRKAKEFMDFWRYASQRYYWANQIVLCSKHHKKYHKELGEDIGENGENISKKRIKEIEEFFK